MKLLLVIGLMTAPLIMAVLSAQTPAVRPLPGDRRALNAAGLSADAASPDVFASRNLTRIPNTGVLSVTVPGVVEGWSALLSKYGTIPISKAVAPATGYAKDGYAVSEIIGGQWKN